MQRSDWHKPTSDDEAKRRAGGRARYNAQRHTVALHRRIYGLLPMLNGYAPARGDLADLARRLGVSRSTVCRDVALLRRAGMLEGRYSVAQLRQLASVNERLCQSVQ